MSENIAKHKPINQTSLKAKLCLSQIRIQQSFKQPFKVLSSLLTVLVYIQCLKYPIDYYSESWFGVKKSVFQLIDISFYTGKISSLVTSSIGILYFIYSVILVFFEKKIKKQGLFFATKILQMGFSSILFMWIVGDTCNSIGQYFFNNVNQSLMSVIFAISSLILFVIAVCLQTYIRFDFIPVCSSSGVIRTSNWSGVTLLIYILANELSSNLTVNNTSIHLIIMSISFAFHIFIFFLKSEHFDDLPIRFQVSIMSVNLLAIAMLDSMQLLKIKIEIGLLIILSIIAILSVSQLQFFNIAFELQNVNKWSNSQIMISYAAKLRKLLLNFNDYYYNTLFLGYIQIHQQKCDNQTCPLRTMPADDMKKQQKFQEIIKKIYNDGCKLTPVNPQLQLEYAIFYYETGAKQKSMKMLLEIKQSELAIDKYYKFSRLKNLIHKQICQLPHQDFLDLLSEIKVKDLQQKIIKKFEQAALVNLQFWSVLNEDHPDFRKLHEVGKSRVLVSNQVHSLYKQITQIAHSERVTSLYIHYLNGIENEEKLFSEIYGDIRKQQGFQQKIIIQDWTNNSNPIMIVSIEEQNLGSIIDLNTTCATTLGYQRFDLLGKDVKTIFPNCLINQIETFLDTKLSKQTSDEPFYIGYSNGYALRITRKVQSYNSIETGLSLIITIQRKFYANTGFIVFDLQNKLVTMQASCLQLLCFEDNILEVETHYDDLFSIRIQDINEQKNILKLSSYLKSEGSNKVSDSFESETAYLDRTFNVSKKMSETFYIVNFMLIKNNKIGNRQQGLGNDLQKLQKFTFNIISTQDEFTFKGSRDNIQNGIALQPSFIINLKEQKSKQFKRDYAQNITTLRLHENYIKVIEQSEKSQEGDTQSKAQTNNELVAKVNSISRGDQEKIFESRETYWHFIESNIKKIYIRTGLMGSILLSVGIYVGLFFLFTANYQQINKNYSRLILQNQVIGEIAATHRIIVQSKYRSKINDTSIDNLLYESYRHKLQHLQELVGDYTSPYPIDVMIDPNNSQQFKSDEFILAYISEFSKIYTDVLKNGFDKMDINSNSTLYIETNGNLTKQKMYEHVAQFKEKAHQSSLRALNLNIVFNAVGILLEFIFTVVLLYTLKKVNQYKVELLSVFLETSQKDIQSYSEKTENFLITLHVDDSNQNVENVEELIDGKKISSAMFAKKKRFKSTQFQKSPYFILGCFFFFASAFYIHSFSFSYQKEVFLVDAIQFINIASQYSDVFSYEQAKIDKKLYNSLGSTERVTDNALTGQVNTRYLQYERDYFTWHYKTFGAFEEYHIKFSTIFMKDICNGNIKVPYACESGIMATNGTLLMLTDITVINQQLDFSQPLSKQYYYSMQAIKEAHQILSSQVIKINQQFFQIVFDNARTIMIIWVIVLVLIGCIIEFYVQKVIVTDMQLVKCMLKFFPISFARDSEGVKSFISCIIEQQGNKVVE